MKNKAKLRILIDMDDTTCDLGHSWEKWINENGDPDFKWENVKSWNVYDWTSIGKKCYDFCATPGVFLDLEPLPDSILVINRLKQNGHDIHFCTSDPKNSITKEGETLSNAKLEKIEWLKYHFKWFNPDEHITFSQDKGSVPGDVLFDDRAKWSFEFPGKFVCLDTPYNQNAVGFRIYSWLEFDALIEDLAAYQKKK